MTSAKLPPYTIWFDNSSEYHGLKREIFTHRVYDFETTNPTPVIIDAGAHIGLTTLFFKKTFPQAEITALEPHPRNFALLEKNIFENQVEGVITHQVALAPQPGDVTLFADASGDEWLSTAGIHNGAWTGTQTSESFTAPGKPLTDFLNKPIDLLKMDIEGAEGAVLAAAGDQLKNVKQMVIEFHPSADQSLPKILDFLHNHSFRTEIWQDGKELKPPQRMRGLLYIHAYLVR